MLSLALAEAPNHSVASWFLVLGLFLPRVTLVAAFLNHQVPPNQAPFLVDVLGTMFLPRVLICVYIAENRGYNEWFWLHLVIALLVYGFSSSKGHRAYQGRRDRAVA